MGTTILAPNVDNLIKSGAEPPPDVGESTPEYRVLEKRIQSPKVAEYGVLIKMYWDAYINF